MVTLRNALLAPSTSLALLQQYLAIPMARFRWDANPTAVTSKLAVAEPSYFR